MPKLRAVCFKITCIWSWAAIDYINYVRVEIKFYRFCFNKECQMTDSTSYEAKMHFFMYVVQFWSQMPTMLNDNWLKVCYWLNAVPQLLILQGCCKCGELGGRLCHLSKVHIFWEGHNILQNFHYLNFHLAFDSTYLQIKVRWRFRKMLWPSQNVWILLKVS